MNIVIMSRGKFPGLDGPYRRTKLLGAGFARNGCDVTLIVAYPPGEGKCDDIFFDRYGYRYIHTMRSVNAKDVGFLKDIYHKIAGTFKLLKLFGNINRQKTVDVLFVSGVGFLELLTAVLIKWVYHTKITIDKTDVNYQFLADRKLSFRNLLSGLNIQLGEVLLRRYVDIVFVVNSYLFKMYDGRTFGKVKMITPSLIDCSEYAELRGDLSQFKLCRAKYKLVCVGMAESYFYGMVPFFEALSELGNDYDYHLFVLGPNDSNYFELLNEKLIQFNIADKTTIIYDLTAPEIELLYGRADILLLAQTPPVIAEGGFPGKTSEYLFSGTPVITTMFSDLNRYLEDGKNCLIVPYGQIDSYIKALCLLFNSESLRKSLGAEGRKTAYRNFDFISGTNQLVKEFEQVLCKSC